MRVMRSQSLGGRVETFSLFLLVGLWRNSEHNLLLEIVFVHNPSKISWMNQKLFLQKFLLQKNFSLWAVQNKLVKTKVTNICWYVTVATEKGRPVLRLFPWGFFFCLFVLFFESLIKCQNRNPEIFCSKEAILKNHCVLCCLLVLSSNLCWVALFAMEFLYNPLIEGVLSLYWRCSSDIAPTYFFHPSKVTEHVTSKVSGGKFRIK